MNLWHLVKKDLRFFFKNWASLIIFFLLPIFGLSLSIGLFFNLNKELTVYINNENRALFENVPTINNDTFLIKVCYSSINEIKKIIQEGGCAVALYNSGSDNTLYINRSIQKSTVIADAVKNHLLIKRGIIQNIQYDNFPGVYIFLMLLNALIFLGCLSLTSSSLAQEIENQTILLLKKSGFSFNKIFIAKILSVIIIELPVYYLIITFCVIINIIPFTPFLILAGPLALILASGCGIILSSITIKREIQSALMLIFILPSFYLAQTGPGIKTSLVNYLLYVDPMALATDLIRNICYKVIDPLQWFAVIVSILLIFSISKIFITKNLIKNM